MVVHVARQWGCRSGRSRRCQCNIPCAVSGMENAQSVSDSGYSAGRLDGEYPKAAFPRQSAAVVMKTLSYRQRSNCVLHVFQIAGFDNQNHALPRFVTEFSLQPGDTRQITFLSWTTRNPPHRNDPTFMLSGPLAPGWGGNVFTLPCGSYDIDIRIGVPEADATVVRCRVWVDGNNLRATLQED
jgi:hypothetical protein